MKKIKEIIIMLLVCLLTMIFFAVVLYAYIPNKKVVPEIVKFTATEEVQDLLADNIDSKEKDDVLLTYEVTASDLNNYESIDAYVPGKANPFEEFKGHTEDTVTNDGSNTTDQSNNSNNTLEEGTVPSVYSDKSGTK